MTLLGSFALWAAFLLGLWGAGLSFFGSWQGNPATALAVRRSVYAVCAALLVATLSLWKGIFSHDFNIEYVAAYTAQPARLLHRRRRSGAGRRARCSSGPRARGVRGAGAVDTSQRYAS